VPVDEPGSLRVQVAGMAPGTDVHLKVFRGRSYKNMTVTLAEYPKNLLAGNTPGDDDNEPGLNGGEKGAMKGVSVQALTSEVRQQLNLPANVKGVVVTDVDESSSAAQEGLRPGDVVEQVNHKPVSTVADFNNAVKQSDGSGATLLLVRRGQVSNFVAVPNK
jgi:serine protease Do